MASGPGFKVPGLVLHFLPQTKPEGTVNTTGASTLDTAPLSNSCIVSAMYLCEVRNEAPAKDC